MAAKKKPSAAQLAARAKFVAMVRAKSKAKKSATKKATVKKAAPKKAAKKKVAKKKVSGLDKVVRRGSKTNVHYSRISGLELKYKSAIRIYFKNPKYNYTTDISNQATEESCKSYFVGKYFNVGIYPKENLQKCIRIKLYKYLVK